MKKLNAKRISVIIAAVIFVIGCVVNTLRAYDVAVWWSEHCGYEPDPSNYFRDTLKNIPGEWLILDFDIRIIFPLALVYLLVQLALGIIHRVSKKRHADPEAAEKSERKTSKVLFILSFLPFTLYILWCFISMFTGAKTGILGTYTVYGFEAFASSFIWVGLALCILPVFPAMLIYQTIYIVRTYRTRKEAAS